MDIQEEIVRSVEKMRQWYELAQRGELQISMSDYSSVCDLMDRYQEQITGIQVTSEFEQFFNKYEEMCSCIMQALVVSSINETNNKSLEQIEEKQLNKNNKELIKKCSSNELSDYDRLSDQLSDETQVEPKGAVSKIVMHIEDKSEATSQIDSIPGKCYHGELPSKLVYFSGNPDDWFIFERVITKELLERNLEKWKKFIYFSQSLSEGPRKMISRIDPYDPQCLNKAINRLRRCYDVGEASESELVRAIQSMATFKMDSLATWQQLLNMAVRIESLSKSELLNVGQIVQVFLRCLPEGCANDFNHNNTSLDSLIELFRSRIRWLKLTDNLEGSTTNRDLSSKNEKSLCCPICNLLKKNLFHPVSNCRNIDEAIRYLASMTLPQDKEDADSVAQQSSATNKVHPEQSCKEKKSVKWKARLAIMSEDDKAFYYNVNLDINANQSSISSDECGKLGVEVGIDNQVTLNCGLGWIVMPISFLVKSTEETGGLPVVLGRSAAFHFRLWVDQNSEEVQQKLKIRECEEMPTQEVVVGDIKLPVRPFMPKTPIDWLIENGVLSPFSPKVQNSHSTSNNELSPFFLEFGENKKFWLRDSLPTYTMQELKAHIESSPCKLTCFVLQHRTNTLMLWVKPDNCERYTILSLPLEPQQRDDLFTQLKSLQESL